MGSNPVGAGLSLESRNLGIVPSKMAPAPPRQQIWYLDVKPAVVGRILGEREREKKREEMKT